MVDRLNSMPPMPLPGSANPDRNMGSADFGSFLGTGQENGRPQPRLAGSAASVAASDLAAVQEPGQTAMDEQLHGSQSAMRKERIDQLSIDPTQGIFAMADPARAYAGVGRSLSPGIAAPPPSPEAQNGILEALPAGVSIDPSTAAQVSVQWIAPGLDIPPKEGLLVEYEIPVPTTTTAAMAAASTEGRAAVVVRLDAQAPGQREQLLASPWHLLAGDHLSQMIAGGKRIALAIGMQASAAQQPLAGHALFTEGKTADVDTVDPLSMRQPGPMASMRAGVPAEAFPETEDAIRGTPSRIGQSGAFVAWPLRLLRWLADGNQDITAWLRDYNLSDSSADAVVRQLRTLSEGQGVRLSRIVLNGRELWRAS